MHEYRNAIWAFVVGVAASVAAFFFAMRESTPVENVYIYEEDDTDISNEIESETIKMSNDRDERIAAIRQHSNS